MSPDPQAAAQEARWGAGRFDDGGVGAVVVGVLYLALAGKYPLKCAVSIVERLKVVIWCVGE